jgi:diguanylate cyclase (GGDEF)-like protein
MNESIAPRILLVDANPEGHALIAQALDRTGIDFSVASSSAQGMEFASGRHHDLILLDSALPDLNGLLTLRQLRGTTKTAAMPIVFMVANTETDLISAAYFEGAVDVLRKPVCAEELQARIKSVLKTQTMLHRLRYLSQNDPLTRLPNRNGMSQWLQRVTDNPGDFPAPYAALVIGVDRLNHFTDLMGHAATDELLRLVAGSMQTILSQSPEVERCCKRFFLARGTSDSFVLLLTGVEGSRAVMGLASSLVEGVSTNYRIGKMQQFITASVGIAISRESQTDFHNLIRFADIAYQDARNAGRSHVQMYNPSMEDVLRRKLDLENDLRLATSNRNFLLEYQPVFNLQTKQCEFAETMIRWDRPNHGIIPLQRFRPIAEENGFMGEIASWALSNACAQFSQWQHESSSDAPRRFSIDLSRKQLQHPQFLEAAVETIQQSRLRNDRVQFEIAESEVMQDREGTIDAIKKLRESGFRILIDEFGMSFSSFHHLSEFPVDGIKLSRSLVLDIETNPLVVKLLEVIVRQTNQANLTVMVDGLETEGQAKILSNIGIRFGQGGLLSNPMDGDSIVPFLFEWKGAMRNKARGKPAPTDAAMPQGRNAYQ